MEQLKISELNMMDVYNDGATFEVLQPQIHPDFENDRRQEEAKYVETAKRFMRTDCFNYISDELPTDSQKSFQVLANKMTNLIPSGKIKKRIIREGYSDIPRNSTTVKIHYNAYTEDDCIPFDSTYTRNEQCLVTIGGGNVIRGLEIAIQSMRMNEKAEFLIDPEYAYKDSGLNRIKRNSVVLFEIEMFDFLSTTINNDENINDFEHVYNCCNELRKQGNNHFKKGNYTGAIQKYKKATNKLDDVVLRDINDQEKCEELLMKLHTNLLVCYTKLELPQKGCLSANKIFYLVDGKRIPIPTKVFFNEAKCLRMLGDYNRALRKLQIALKTEPNHPNIIDEIILTEKAEQDSKKRDARFGKALLNN